jgi:hypothetical protein
VNEIGGRHIKQPSPPPSLSAYYADRKLKPAAFLKAVRAANIKTFQSDDVASAQATLAETDPDLSRTLALGVVKRPPDVIERWVIEIARSAVRILDPALVLEENASAEAIFERIIQAQSNRLQSKSRPSRFRAQNLIRLSLLWLIRGRSLDPLQALHELSAISNKLANRESIRGQAQKILIETKPRRRFPKFESYQTALLSL